MKNSYFNFFMFYCLVCCFFSLQSSFVVKEGNVNDGGPMDVINDQVDVYKMDISEEGAESLFNENGKKSRCAMAATALALQEHSRIENYQLQAHIDRQEILIRDMAREIARIELDNKVMRDQFVRQQAFYEQSFDQLRGAVAELTHLCHHMALLQDKHQMRK